jgi:hypothetical protein
MNQNVIDLLNSLKITETNARGEKVDVSLYPTQTFFLVKMLSPYFDRLEKAEDKVQVYEEALNDIYEFGRKMSGCGFSCSKMAKEALEKAKENLTETPT